jgi:hypothetical protein
MAVERNIMPQWCYLALTERFVEQLDICRFQSDMQKKLEAEQSHMIWLINGVKTIGLFNRQQYRAIIKSIYSDVDTKYSFMNFVLANITLRNGVIDIL